MKKATIMIVLFFGAFVSKLYAQQSVNASGSNVTGSGGNASYTVGQIDYTSTTGSGGNASQGVQQPYEIFTLGTDNFPNINVMMLVYPNPTTTRVNLKIENYTSDHLVYTLFDMRGREIITNKVTQNETQIQMENLASATYLLNVLDNNKLLKTFKIIKKD